MPQTVKIKKLHQDAIIPKYQSQGASGFDFHALEDTTIEAGQTTLVKTGLAFEIPLGFELQIRPRSGISLKTKLRIANSPGTVDSDYRGEVCVMLENTETDISKPFFNYPARLMEIKKGDRIAQGVLVCINQAKFEVVNELSNTERGSEGYGSTGKN